MEGVILKCATRTSFCYFTTYIYFWIVTFATLQMTLVTFATLQVTQVTFATLQVTLVTFATLQVTLHLLLFRDLYLFLDSNVCNFASDTKSLQVTIHLCKWHYIFASDTTSLQLTLYLCKWHYIFASDTTSFVCNKGVDFVLNELERNSPLSL